MNREYGISLRRDLREWERALLESCDLYLVGGTVRDMLRGAPVDSIDEDYLAAGVALEDLTRTLERFGALNLVGRSFGVIKFAAAGARTVDISLPRTEFSTGPGHRDFDVRFDPALPVERDLERRDFTINSMAYHLGTGVLVDPLGGREDLDRGLLRVNRDDSFREDPLRMLRGAQFMARFGLAVEEGTRACMLRDRALVATVSAERVRDEITKLLVLSPRPSTGLLFMHDERILEIILPELDRTYGETQNEYHPDDVFMHSLRSCDLAPADLALRWSALLHDVGKKDRKQVVEGRTVFYRHERDGARMAAEILGRLRYPRELETRVVNLIEHHMFNITGEWSDAAVRRFVARVGRENVADLLALREADGRSRGDDAVTAENERIRERIRRIAESDVAFKISDLAVGGRDVIAALGIEAGPDVGEVLKDLLEVVLDDPRRNTREELLSILEERGKKK
jgi:putative nucleotidyltransferase with HDIG domain